MEINAWNIGKIAERELIGAKLPKLDNDLVFNKETIMGPAKNLANEINQLATHNFVRAPGIVLNQNIFKNRKLSILRKNQQSQDFIEHNQFNMKIISNGGWGTNEFNKENLDTIQTGSFKPRVSHSNIHINQAKQIICVLDVQLNCKSENFNIR